EIDFKSEFDNNISSLNENPKSTELTYSTMTVQELKAILSERNMPTSGRKAELIQRLLDE
ncbi:MAG: SAP domain-containing protein, partial [Candidatus Thermoplasmatota archaeon]|nr:SAP domain-containing protein [Candidatus Thermoplasmatota archaeon]